MWRLLLLVPLLVVPVLPELPDTGKGLAGKPTAHQLQEQGASWWHHWRPCREGEAATGCVDHVKAEWTLYEGPSFYGDLDNMRERLALCEAGWFMFGDEYRLQGWTVDDQVADLAWFVAERDAVNPACKIAFGGVEPWHPSTGSNADWVAEFAEAYQDRYGHLPPVDAVMIDAYEWLWYRPDTFPEAEEMIAEIRRVYGDDVQVWAREIGSLLPGRAQDAIAHMGTITPLLDRWAFFITNDTNEGWGYTALYDRDGNITPVGTKYARWVEPEVYRVYLPQVDSG